MRRLALSRSAALLALLVAACGPAVDEPLDDDELPEFDDPGGGKEDGLTRPLGTYRGSGGDFSLLLVMSDKTFLATRTGRSAQDRGTVKFTTGGGSKYLRLTVGTTDLGRYAYTLRTGTLKLRKDRTTVWQTLQHAEPPACGRAADCGLQGLAADPACTAWVCAAAACARTCGSAPPATQNWNRDVLSTSLGVNIGARTASATVVLAGARQPGASFDVRGLEVRSVRGDTGPLPYRVSAGRLDVGVAASGGPARVVVDYAFVVQRNFDGLLSGGATFTWPYYCGNVFPCRTDPADGLRFELSLTGTPSGKRAVYPARIPADAPAYMLAWAVGDYAYKTLGRTPAGTKVGVYSLPSTTSTQLTKGTSLLVKAFGWLEAHLGPYTFGPEVASVDVMWGNGGSYGGMEHHPFWHVSHGAMNDRVTHVHEAAHGWFGDGVRIACWEDFVLSEGTTTYVTAKALGAAGGAAVEQAVWAGYAQELADGIATEDTIAWPQGCGGVDVLTSGLYSSIPYQKGAHFYRAVEQQVGAAALERALARFYRERVGTAARMQDMLDTIEDETGFDPTALANAWLRSRGRP